MKTYILVAIYMVVYVYMVVYDRDLFKMVHCLLGPLCTAVSLQCLCQHQCLCWFVLYSGNQQVDVVVIVCANMAVREVASLQTLQSWQTSNAIAEARGC